jgi:hypothetical protein
MCLVDACRGIGLLASLKPGTIYTMLRKSSIWAEWNHLSYTKSCSEFHHTDINHHARKSEKEFMRVFQTEFLSKYGAFLTENILRGFTLGNMAWHKASCMLTRLWCLRHVSFRCVWPIRPRRTWSCKVSTQNPPKKVFPKVELEQSLSLEACPRPS